jgi:catechol 2,3-dioxygenase-like lactoylglutathione lyase family enzyme
MTEGRNATRGWPAELPVQQVRITRPTNQLAALIDFYRDGLGLAELFRFEGHDGYAGIMLGLPDAAYHLEFTQHIEGSPGPAPTRDNLLVLYFASPETARRIADRLLAHGGTEVEAENPYWTRHGAITIEDPDRWRVVCMPTSTF